MASLYLHIGMPKTGTTAIQTFLNDNAEVLERNKICFPDFGFRYPRVGVLRNAHFLFYVETDESGEFITTPAYPKAYAKYRSALDQIGELGKHYDKIILSDEALWRRKSSRPAFWKGLKKDLESKGLTLHLIVYLRRQDDFAQSMYRQKVRSFHTCLTFSDFLKNFTESYPLDYPAYLNMLSECVGRENISLRVYESRQYRGEEKNLFSDFLDVLGLSFSDGFEVKQPLCNIALDDSQLELRRILNTLPEPPYKTNALLNGMEYVPLQNPNPKGTGKTGFFKPGEQSAYLERFAESNAKLAREYLGREDGVLFYNRPETDLPESEANTRSLLYDTILLYGRSTQLLEQEIKEIRAEVEDIKRSSILLRLRARLSRLLGRS